MKDYSRKIALLCPVCGNDQFGSDNENDDEVNDDTVFKCSDCGNEFTRVELIEFNQEIISNNIDEMVQDVTSDITKKMKKIFLR